MNYLALLYLHTKTRFKQCDHCKRFFATTGQGNPRFCNRLIEGANKTCRQMMPKVQFEIEVERTPAKWLYNRAYRTMYSRIFSGAITKDMFKNWMERARSKRDACLAGELSAEEYSAWLYNSELGIDYLKEKK